MSNSKSEAKLRGEKSGKISSYIVLCFFAAFNIGIFIPLDLFISNATEFLFPLKPLIRLLLLITAAVFAVTFLACILTKGKTNTVCVSVIFGVSFASYIQSSFLSVNMGQLDGSEYSSPVLKTILNTTIWLVLLAAPFVIRRKSLELHGAIVSYVPAAVILIEIIALGAGAYMAIPKWSASTVSYVLYGEQHGYCTMKNFDAYSKEKNFLIILADEYDSFYFDEAIKEHPETISEFNGFTYYTNTVGKYPFTSPSVSYITTGTANTDTNDSYENLTFWQNMDAQYETNIYAMVGIPPEDIFSQFADNYYLKKVTLGDAFTFSQTLYKLTFFRCMPELAKPIFFTDGTTPFEPGSFTDYNSDEYAEYPYSNLGFYRNIPTNPKLTDEYQFKFIYILGLHNPRDTTSDLELSNTAVSPEETAIAVNKIMNEYFKTLKDNGIYDNSEILFLADHGFSGNDGKKYPLLMYKPAHQTETGIKVSNAPISHDDLYPTLIKLSGGVPEARTIFDIAEDEQRTRHFEGTNEDITWNIKQPQQ